MEKTKWSHFGKYSNIVYKQANIFSIENRMHIFNNNWCLSN